MDKIIRSQFRIPEPLHEKLKESADTNNRSINAELVNRLEESFASENFDKYFEPGQILALLVEKLATDPEAAKRFKESAESMKIMLEAMEKRELLVEHKKLQDRKTSKK